MLRRRLDESRSFDDVFEVVKRAVEQVLGLHRAGLTLVLADLPNHIGAYHILGSNLIVLNRTLLGVVRANTENRADLNSYLFVVLGHEYLHSLGITDERRVRLLLRRIAREALGPAHPSVGMATGNISARFPQFRHLGAGRFGGSYEVVNDFDRDSMPYIG